MRYTHYAIKETLDIKTLVLLKKEKGIKQITYRVSADIEIIRTIEDNYAITNDITFKKLTADRWNLIKPILIAQLQEAINDLGNKDIVFHSGGAAKKSTPKTD